MALATTLLRRRLISDGRNYKPLFLDMSAYWLANICTLCRPYYADYDPCDPHSRRG